LHETGSFCKSVPPHNNTEILESLGLETVSETTLASGMVLHVCVMLGNASTDALGAMVLGAMVLGAMVLSLLLCSVP
jgi:hypothetical protein